jgi:hypothetical protein
MLLGTVSLAVALLAGVRLTGRDLHARATLADVEGVMRAWAVPEARIARVLRLARDRRYAPSTLSRWAAEHGGDRLALVLDAGVGERALLDHLEAGTEPDWRALAVFAEIAVQEQASGMPVAEMTDLDAVPLISDLLLLGDLYDWTTTDGPDQGGRKSWPIATWGTDDADW